MLTQASSLTYDLWLKITAMPLSRVYSNMSPERMVGMDTTGIGASYEPVGMQAFPAYDLNEDGLWLFKTVASAVPLAIPMQDSESECLHKGKHGCEMKVTDDHPTGLCTQCRNGKCQS
ncbi:uncharacterized protein PG986_007933 [Apiospora aurea]|uniref:Uncharacterized protein n=1 Tax=Apiospora aurea TaxID=335848 RepID=A0ABR1QE01_9PEZI